ncbi:MAG: U32 family peptidase [Candidatus Woesearchaeota archaeon]
MSADNFNENNLSDAIDYCHKRKVKVYITLNILIKNNEIKNFLEQIKLAYDAGTDAVIIQDPCFIPLIKKNFPDISIHLSTQATSTNSFSVPKFSEEIKSTNGIKCAENVKYAKNVKCDKNIKHAKKTINRVILPRELSLDEIKEISKHHETEVFVHGALCFCYSGQCIFSSFAGGRSGNRGRCAQPCRKKYNNKYILSTKDLCTLPMLPDIIKAGVSSLKVEGRLRTPFYVATVACIYRKYIDLLFDKDEKFNFKSVDRYNIEDKDMDDLFLAFNRKFTTGFAFNDSIVDSANLDKSAKLAKPINRGLFLGNINSGKIRLRKGIKVGDGIGIWSNDDVIGHKIEYIKLNGENIVEADKGDEVEINLGISEDGLSVYKTSSADSAVNLGDELPNINIFSKKIQTKDKYEISYLYVPIFNPKPNKDKTKIFIKVYNKKSAIEAAESGADVIYYDLFAENCINVKKLVDCKFFVYTPCFVSDKDLPIILEKIKEIDPDGILVSDRGLLFYLSENLDSFDKKIIHLDYSLNTFNDIDISYYNEFNAIPIISQELSFEEIKNLKDKNFIVLIHGDIILMSTKEPIRASLLIDEDERRFKVNCFKIDGKCRYYQILNNKQIGLFNKTKDYLTCGVKFFFIDLKKDTGKFVRIYKQILSNQAFDDKRIRKGYTTGHFNRGVD